jgi:glycosyltransferase involved in cell wall biosynthesis
MILGEGPDRPALQAEINALGLGARVALPGFDPNPFRYLARARLFVLSSAWEGLPGVLIQAMACGTPVVSTDCPSGPREVLENGRLGPLVPVGDAEALAAAIGRTLDQPLPAATLSSEAKPQTDESMAPCCLTCALLQVGQAPRAEGRGSLPRSSRNSGLWPLALGARPFLWQARCRHET